MDTLPRFDPIQPTDGGDDQGPFHPPMNQQWQDFWTEAVKHLSPRVLFYLSRVSKSWHSLVWSILIPNSTSGLILSQDSPLPIVQELVSRTPSLKNLNFYRIRDPNCQLLLESLMMVTRLSSIGLPRPSNKTTPFPFESISHLRDLTGIITHQALCQKAIQHFCALKGLTCIEAIREWEGLTRLQKLDVRQYKNENPQISLLTRLNNLTFFHQSDACDLSALTGLTKLRFSPTNILGLTNLTKIQDLCLAGGRHITEQYVLDATRCLTNLTKLSLSWYRGQLTPNSISNIPGLTNLTYLAFPHDLVAASLPVIHGLTSLKTLIMEDPMLTAPNFNYQPVKHVSALTQLTTLSLVGAPWPLTFLCTLDKLVSLILVLPSISENSMAHFSELGSLTALTSLSLHHSASSLPGCLSDLEGLTHIKCLGLYYPGQPDQTVASLTSFTHLDHLALTSNDLTDQGIAHLACLTNLRSLKISGPWRTSEQITQGDLKPYLAPLYPLTNLQDIEVDSHRTRWFWIEQQNFLKQTKQ